MDPAVSFQRPPCAGCGPHSLFLGRLLVAVGLQPHVCRILAINRKARGTASTNTIRPKTVQVIRQLVAWSKNIAKGTIKSPPAEAPLAFKPITVARRRRNHLARIAPVLFMEAELTAVESTKPNIKIRNRMWKVRLSRTVTKPMTIRPVRINFRPPVASNIDLFVKTPRQPGARWG